MDQTICAFAYDNSRSRHKKWVGKTNPNGPATNWALRDHSNGDMASPIHCWRLRLQAPPTFVVILCQCLSVGVLVCLSVCHSVSPPHTPLSLRLQAPPTFEQISSHNIPTFVTSIFDSQDYVLLRTPACLCLLCCVCLGSFSLSLSVSLCLSVSVRLSVCLSLSLSLSLTPSLTLFLARTHARTHACTRARCCHLNVSLGSWRHVPLQPPPAPPALFQLLSDFIPHPDELGKNVDALPR